jgi:hypothetical protein
MECGLCGRSSRREHHHTGPGQRGLTPRAALPDLKTLTPAERALLGDWFDRIATRSPPARRRSGSHDPALASTPITQFGVGSHENANAEFGDQIGGSACVLRGLDRRSE